MAVREAEMNDDHWFRKWLMPLFIAGGLAWISYIGWRTYSGWPSIPLDMDAGNPAVQQAYQDSVSKHVLNGLLLAVTPVVLIFASLRMTRR